MFNDEVLDKLKVLREEIWRSGCGSLSHYGHIMIKEDKLEHVYCGNHACIAPYNSKYTFWGATPLCILYCLKGCGKVVSKRRKKWVNYLLHRSPWRYAYTLLDKYNEETNFICARCDVDANYVGTAVNILRLGLENDDHLQKWQRMVDAGLHEDLALVLSCSEVMVKGKTVICDLMNVDENYTYYGHSVFSLTFSKSFVEYMLGATYHNDIWDRGAFTDVKCYEGAYAALSGNTGWGVKFFRTNFKGLDEGKEASQILDLLDRPTHTHKLRKYNVEVLNNKWKELCEQYL